ncbi:MAG: hypothetical protein WCF60_16775 [Anaerobacillus sp.]
MIYYMYNPEFDQEILDFMRGENTSKSQDHPSITSTVYLFDVKNQTTGYMWLEIREKYVELVEFFFKGSVKEMWGLYEFIVGFSCRQSKPFLRMKLPDHEKGNDLIKRWGGEVVERDEKELLIEIPFLSYQE